MSASSPTGARTWRRPVLPRDPAQGHRAATPLELLFDLCFVVAVARAAVELHHGLAEAHTAEALLGYAMVFFAIWWAWMNFTWYASAYDTDDVPYRLLTLLQMAGVLILAAGVPATFEHYDFRVATLGYVVMRVAMIGQWLRAAYHDEEGRATALRYAGGIALVQVGWVLRLLLPETAALVGFLVLLVAELAVPAIAERARPTTWHPEHIAERYGLFTIIVLGEVVLASTAAVGSAIDEGGLTLELGQIAAGGLLLVFSLWWAYFKTSYSEGIRRSLASALGWGYAHYAVFATGAALGAGLEVVIDVVGHKAHVGEAAGGFAVAVPVSAFLVLVSILQRRTNEAAPRWELYAVGMAVLLLALAALGGVLGLATVVLLMGLAVAAFIGLGVLIAHRHGLAVGTMSGA